ncbi:MAG TPA: sigma-70 family RNA polymerase sigma factor, partial [Kofleriaceae bacterium]|nr:sigma-70 family RNA polymerase sigma factor [Kofleriaceae bacterium]
YIAPLAHALRKVTNEAEVADVLQAVRIKFLVGDDGRPRIAEYDGASALASWLRVAAVRMAISAYRKHAREAPHEEVDVPAASTSPELELLQRTYGSAFRDAFRTAFLALEPRERTLLRQQVLDQLGIDRLALLYGVHRATAARWVAQARQRLIDGVRGELQAALAIDSEQLDSALRMVGSQLEISVRMFLTPTPA